MQLRDTAPGCILLLNPKIYIRKGELRNGYMSTLSDANLLLKEESLWFLWHYACINWTRLHKIKTGVCKHCGETKQTYLHHLDPTLKPPKLFYNGKNNSELQILYDRRGKSAREIYQDFLRKYSDLIFQTIRYYSINENEVIELCAKCHAKEHRELEREK